MKSILISLYQAFKCKIEYKITEYRFKQWQAKNELASKLLKGAK